MKTFRNILLLLAWLAAGSLSAQGIVWHNPLDGDPPCVGGRAWNAEIGRQFHRLPARFEATMPKSVWNLSRQAGGLEVRFVSTSRNVSVRYKVRSMPGYWNMATADHSGVDLYGTDANGRQHWIGVHMRWTSRHDTITYRYEDIQPAAYSDRGLLFTLYLPPYNEVESLEVGTDSGATFRFLQPSAERPVVVYGSSIVQGASPSRPGLMWTHLLERMSGYPVVNLGFSGSALMEPAVFDALAEIDARAFILDPMPNSYGLGEEITRRAVEGVRKLRTHSEAPILMAECHLQSDRWLKPALQKQYADGNAHFRQAYETLKNEGCQNLFYLGSDRLDLGEEGMIEGTHPNDIGNMAYARAYDAALREMLPEDSVCRRHHPLTQRRDAVYEWPVRHNEVIALNHATDPEILMIGNSIIHFWGGEPLSHCNGGGSWKRLFGRRRVTNMGFGWDRIDNVFWRIQHGELEGCRPGHVCLLIGINDLLAGERPDTVARGIADLAGELRRRLPEARLHVLCVLPAKGKEAAVKETNRLLRQYLKTDSLTDLVDLTETLTLDDGKVNPALFLEGLHPNERGYDAIAKRLRKVLGKW